MSKFDLKKFLVENKLTAESKNSAIPSIVKSYGDMEYDIEYNGVVYRTEVDDWEEADDHGYEISVSGLATVIAPKNDEEKALEFLLHASKDKMSGDIADIEDVELNETVAPKRTKRNSLKEETVKVASPLKGRGWDKRFFEQIGLLELFDNFKLFEKEVNGKTRGTTIGLDSIYDIVHLLKFFSKKLEKVSNEVDILHKNESGDEDDEMFADENGDDDDELFADETEDGMGGRD